MSSFTYNDQDYVLETTGSAWNIVVQRPGSKSALVGAGLFSGENEQAALARAQKLVRTLAPVGVRVVGPDVARALRIGDLKIVPPDVTHPNFIYWDKNSSSCPQQI